MKKKNAKTPPIVDQKTEKPLTTSQGVPIPDNQNSLRIGPSGPTLLEDFHLREKIFHFDHERIPERVVHARGFGAHGFFETYESLTEITCADIFQREREKTPAFVRFSTVVGNKGSCDLARDVRGFAVKLYTKEGNWDIVGNNIPVFFIQDALKFPDLIHAAKQEPDSGFPQAQTAHDNFWDFISLTPESMHMVMWIMSDRALPRSFRFMEGFGVHTFRLINADKKSTFVKFHWKPKLGLQSLTWNEAVKLNGMDPDFHRRDLWKAIKAKHFPEWELGLQLFDETFAENFDFDVLDATKLIPEEMIPVKKIGRLVLDRCVDNFFAETEQVAFCTQNIVRGVDFTNDPLLQGRNFSYLDTQVKRLGGPNFTQLPINAPRCPFHNFHQDGHMAFSHPRGRVNYEPNSWGNSLKESPEKGFCSYPAAERGEKIRARSESFSDHYSQARLFYISQTQIEQKHIQDALVFELGKVISPTIRSRVVSHLLNIDRALAVSVAEQLGLTPHRAAEALSPIKELEKAPSLSLLANNPSTFTGRTLGVAITEGVDETLFNSLQKAVLEENAMLEIVAPRIGGVHTKKRIIEAQHTIDNGSVFFDAIVLLLPEQLDEKLIEQLSTFTRDAFTHAKFIAYNQAALSFFKKIQLDLHLDDGFSIIKTARDCKNFLIKCRMLRFLSHRRKGSLVF